MALSFQAMFPQTIQGWGQQILPADTTTKKTLVTGGTNGSIVESINVSNTDSGVAYTLQFYINNGTFDALIGSVNVPLSAGNTTAAIAIDALRSGQFPGMPVDANGNFVIYLKATYILKVAVTVTVTAAKEVDIFAMGADY